MKRRDFISTGTAGAACIGLSGCSSFGLKTVDVKPEQTPIDFDVKVPKPKGTMPTAEIGSTGIKVSKFGFGSHIHEENKTHEKERKWMVREAYDLGINLFDVYDFEGHTFQYEPMGRYLAPMINDVVISISILPWEGRTLERQLEHDLRLFGRDYIDMVRIHSYSSDSSNWYQWEKLFKFKEQGKIRAIGIPIHRPEDLIEPLETYPLDYVIFPFNFYHNWTYLGQEKRVKGFGKYDKLIPELRKRGIGVISMKPFAGDDLVTPFKRLGEQYDKSGEVNIAKASLRYVINSGADIDTTLGGMYNPYHVHENIDAYFKPELSDEERKVLKKIRDTARIISKNLLPEHYQFLEDWVPDSWDDSDLFGKS